MLRKSGRSGPLYILCASVSCVAIGLSLSNYYSHSRAAAEEELKVMRRVVSDLAKENNAQKLQIKNLQVAQPLREDVQRIPSVLAGKSSNIF